MLCMNPLQSARSKAAAYPLYPDALAIINAIAEAAGAPPATELMRRPPDPVRSPELFVGSAASRVLLRFTRCSGIDVVRIAIFHISA